MKKLSEYPNIGPVVEKQLHQVGIQQIDSSACIHRLLALEATIQGIKKKDLSEQDRIHLREFYRQHKL